MAKEIVYDNEGVGIMEFMTSRDPDALHRLINEVVLCLTNEGDHYRTMRELAKVNDVAAMRALAQSYTFRSLAPYWRENDRALYHEWRDHSRFVISRAADELMRYYVRHNAKCDIYNATIHQKGLTDV